MRLVRARLLLRRRVVHTPDAHSLMSDLYADLGGDDSPYWLIPQQASSPPTLTPQLCLPEVEICTNASAGGDAWPLPDNSRQVLDQFIEIAERRKISTLKTILNQPQIRSILEAQ